MAPLGTPPRSPKRSRACHPPTEQVQETEHEDDEGAVENDRREAFEEEEFAGGFDSGYETDPVDRFFVVSKWQKQLRRLQQRLKSRKYNDAPDCDTGASAGGDEIPRPKGVGTANFAPLRGIRQRQRQIASRMTESRTRVVSTIQQRQMRLKEHYEKQVNELKGRLDRVLVQARFSKARQLRHMICFCCSMVDVVVTAFWLGASPMTFHWYYTFKIVALIGTRAVWYRWHGWHYFLFDLCYFSNAVLLIYLWVFPSHEKLFVAVYGFSGVLLISVPVFRNSFVPHSLDRVTSVQIHISPVLQLWALRWYYKAHESYSGTVFTIPDKQLSVWPSLCCYAMWAFTYSLHQFVFGRRHIERKRYATLYHHMAIDMGILKKLPPVLQGPLPSRLVFMAGHMTLFVSGLPCVHFPFWLHTFCICVAIVWAFKNGAAFYITYFWKVYDSQIHAFEQQMLDAQAAADAHSDVSKASTASTPHGIHGDAPNGNTPEDNSPDGDVKEIISSSSELSLKKRESLCSLSSEDVQS